MSHPHTGPESQALAAVQSAIGPKPSADEAEIAAAGHRKARNRRILVNLARALTLLVVIGGWQLLTAKKIVDPFFFGQPSVIWTQLRDWVEHGTAFGSLWLQIWVTLKEALLGFAYGVASGVALGVLLGQNRFLADVVGPYIKVMNAIPRIVLGSIFTIAFGLGTTSKVALAAVLVFFVVFFNAFQGVREVDRNFVANARVLGASRLQVIRNVVLPSALTWIIASLHVAFGFAVIGAIVGEFLGAQQGLGVLISLSQGTLNVDGVFAAMLIIAVVALTAEFLISVLERRLLAWRPPSTTEATAI
jgi:NitT/TauT family transport system permease protein